MASSKRGLWFKFGRFITGLTIACFFLPFFGVSCEGMDVVTISGADMAGGCRPGGLIADAEEQSKRSGMGDGDEMKGGVKVDKVPREPLAIVALGLAIVVFGLSWVRTRGAMLAAVVLSIGCLGALTGLYIKVGGDLKDSVAKEVGKEGMGGQMMRDTKVEAGSRFGLWLSCAGLLASAALCGLALKEPEGTENQPRTPPA